MGIIARYDGRLYAQIKDRNGKWVKRSLDTKDRTVAKARYRDLERAEADPAYRASNETRFEDACADFVTSRSRKGCAADTITFYEKKCKSLRAFVGDDTSLARIDANLVDAFIDHRLAEGAARRSIGMELGALRGVLKVARRAGKFTVGVDTVMPTDWSDDYQPVERNLTPDEVRRLVAELAAENTKPQGGGKERNALNQAASVAYMVATGARLGEMRRAERAHIRLDEGLVFVSSTKTRRKGRGDRYVPITPLTRELLVHVLAATEGRRKLFDPWANYGRDIDAACTRAGIAHCSPNDLRRTHGTWLRKAGVEPNLIGASLGHMDSRMVERVYGRLAPEALLKLLLERTGTREGQDTRPNAQNPPQRDRARPSKTP